MANQVWAKYGFDASPPSNKRQGPQTPKTDQFGPPSTYGGDFPWVGCRYKTKVQSGATLLGWINQAKTLFVDQLTFHADGSIGQKNFKPFAAGKTQRCWRWDELGGRIVIDYLRDGKKSEHRWEELYQWDCPDGDVTAAVSKWDCVAHVGTSSYSFTLSLVDEIPTQAWPLGLSDSLLVSHGSILLPPEETESGDLLKNIVDKHSFVMDSEKASTDHILAIIDRMWLQELVLQSQAQLLIALIDIAKEVELGLNPEEMKKRAKKEMKIMKAMAFDSMKVRSEARGSISLEGGMEGLREILATQLDEAQKGVKHLIGQLVEPLQVGKVRKSAKKRLQNVVAELQAISDLKEVNSDMFSVHGEKLDDLQLDQSFFTDTVLQAARANPQNHALQKACVEPFELLPDACSSHNNSPLDGSRGWLLETIDKRGLFDSLDRDVDLTDQLSMEAACVVVTTDQYPFDIVSADDAWYRTWGFDRNEAIGSPISILNGEGFDKAASQELYARFLQSSKETTRCTNTPKDGRCLSHDAVLNKLDDGQIRCFSTNFAQKQGFADVSSFDNGVFLTDQLAMKVACVVVTTDQYPFVIVFADAAWFHTWGFSPNEAIGSPISILNGKGFDKSASQELYARFLQSSEQTTRCTNTPKSGRCLSHDSVLNKLDGQIRCYSTNFALADQSLID